MKITGVKFETPKTKESALNLAAYMSEQLEIYKRRKVNLVKSKSDTEVKLKRLQEQLTEIDKQISTVNTNESNWKSQLNSLQTNHSLTEAEILETKSEILRKKINSLRKEAGVEFSGETDLI